jgi:hypothetical protein
MSKKGRYPFELLNIEPDKIEASYGITIGLAGNISSQVPAQRTKIEELQTNKETKKVISFIDEARLAHKCQVITLRIPETTSFGSTSLREVRIRPGANSTLGASLERKNPEEFNTTKLGTNLIGDFNRDFNREFNGDFNREFNGEFNEEINRDFDFTPGPNQQLCCYWDRHPLPYNCYPFGCPIRFVPPRVVKNYISEVSKDFYTISETVTPQRAAQVEERKNTGNDKIQPSGAGCGCAERQNNEDRNSITNSIIIEAGNYYEVEGIFCSFQCCLAYLEDNKANPIYNHSGLLLRQFYRDLTGHNFPDMHPAPSWKLLKNYGGILSIEEFRASFSNQQYIDHGWFIPSRTYPPATNSSVEQVSKPKQEQISMLTEIKFRL